MKTTMNISKFKKPIRERFIGGNNLLRSKRADLECARREIRIYAAIQDQFGLATER